MGQTIKSKCTKRCIHTDIYRIARRTVETEINAKSNDDVADDADDDDDDDDFAGCCIDRRLFSMFASLSLLALWRTTTILNCDAITKVNVELSVERAAACVQCALNSSSSSSRSVPHNDDDDDNTVAATLRCWCC